MWKSCVWHELRNELSSVWFSCCWVKVIAGARMLSVVVCQKKKKNYNWANAFIFRMRRDIFVTGIHLK